jgi:hypothetical protein
MLEKWIQAVVAKAISVPTTPPAGAGAGADAGADAGAGAGTDAGAGAATEATEGDSSADGPISPRSIRAAIPHLARFLGTSFPVGRGSASDAASPPTPPMLPSFEPAVPTASVRDETMPMSDQERSRNYMVTDPET